MKISQVNNDLLALIQPQNADNLLVNANLAEQGGLEDSFLEQFKNELTSVDELVLDELVHADDELAYPVKVNVHGLSDSRQLANIDTHVDCKLDVKPNKLVNTNLVNSADEVELAAIQNNQMKIQSSNVQADLSNINKPMSVTTKNHTGRSIENSIEDSHLFIDNKNIFQQNKNSRSLNLNNETSLNRNPYKSMSQEDNIIKINFNDSTQKDNSDLMSSKPFVTAPIVATANIESNSTAPVFDLNQLASVDNLDTNTLIEKISDYIIQAKVGNQNSVQMNVQHEDLGQIQIMVEKMAKNSDDLNIIISGQNSVVQNILSQNGQDLMSSLAKAGIQVLDLKFEVSQASNTSQANLSDDNGSNQSSEQKEFSSKNNQQNHDSQRRNELWEIFNQRDVA
jgi:hypothetical protein